MVLVLRLHRCVRHFWLLIIVVPTLLVGGLTVGHFHRIFGAGPPNSAGDRRDEIILSLPKYVTYEIVGPSIATGSVSYVDGRAEVREASFSTLPWSLTVNTVSLSMFANVMAQRDGMQLGCKIIVNGELRTEQIVAGHHASTFCLVKVA